MESDPNERRYLFDPATPVPATGNDGHTPVLDPFPPSGFPGDEHQETTTTGDESGNGSGVMSRFQAFFRPDIEEELAMAQEEPEKPKEETMEDVIIANEDYINSLNAEERQGKVREGIRTGSLLLLGLTAIGFLLIYLDFIMIPLVFSRGLVYVFQPFINYFVGKKPLPFCKKRLHLPRWFAVFLCVILIAVTFFLIGLMIEFSVRQVLLEKESYIHRFDEMYAAFIVFAESLGYTQENVEALWEQLDLSSYAFDLIKELMAELPNIFLILLFTLYMLLDYEEQAEKSKLRLKVDLQIRQYIIIKVLVSVFVGFAVGFTFLLLGAHLALFFGLMTFVLNFIPNIGAIIATFLPMPGLLTLSPSSLPLPSLLIFLFANLMMLVKFVLSCRLPIMAENICSPETICSPFLLLTPHFSLLLASDYSPSSQWSYLTLT
jgi:predicted PurR-regulated permease PerM